MFLCKWNRQEEITGDQQETANKEMVLQVVTTDNFSVLMFSGGGFGDLNVVPP